LSRLCAVPVQFGVSRRPRVVLVVMRGRSQRSHLLNENFKWKVTDMHAIYWPCSQLFVKIIQICYHFTPFDISFKICWLELDRIKRSATNYEMNEAANRWRWAMKIQIYRDGNGAFGGGSVLGASGSYQVVDSASNEHILTGSRHFLDENDSSTGAGRWRASARWSGRRRSTARWCGCANLRKRF